MLLLHILKKNIPIKSHWLHHLIFCKFKVYRCHGNLFTNFISIKYDSVLQYINIVRPRVTSEIRS